MTAEIVVMNKLAVALAADSAASTQVQYGLKVSNAASKPFALSKTHPVGIMVYGSSELNNVPWELIIRQYRRCNGQKSQKTIVAYKNDFIEFLSCNSPITPSVQENYVESMANIFFGEIEDEFKKGMKQLDR